MLSFLTIPSLYNYVIGATPQTDPTKYFTKEKKLALGEDSIDKLKEEEDEDLEDGEHICFAFEICKAQKNILDDLTMLQKNDSFPFSVKKKPTVISKFLGKREGVQYREMI